VSITELDQGSLGRYILQSGRDATGSLRRSGCRSRSCGSHPCSILRLLAVVRRLTVRARRGRELGRSPREGQRTRCGKGLGLSRVGRMRLNTLHDEGYVVAQRSVCGQPSRSDEEPVSDCESRGLCKAKAVRQPRRAMQACEADGDHFLSRNGHSPPCSHASLTTLPSIMQYQRTPTKSREKNKSMSPLQIDAREKLLEM
jgi:hypothetical protein